jgi:hypothetical protein
MRNMIVFIGALGLVGCGGADLPEGWENATAIEGLTQSECKGSLTSSDRMTEALKVIPEAAAVRLEYSAAPFRCQQDVEAFARIESGKVDVLVQPVDMNPSSVAKCGCVYDINMTIKGLPKGAVDGELYRRSDNLNDPNTPHKVVSIAGEAL